MVAWTYHLRDMFFIKSWRYRIYRKCNMPSTSIGRWSVCPWWRQQKKSDWDAECVHIYHNFWSYDTCWTISGEWRNWCWFPKTWIDGGGTSSNCQGPTFIHAETMPQAFEHWYYAKTWPLCWDFPNRSKPFAGFTGTCGVGFAWICITGSEGSVTEWLYDADWSYDSSTAMDAKPAIHEECIAWCRAVHAQNIIEGSTFSYNRKVIDIFRTIFLSNWRTCKMIFNFTGESQAGIIEHLQYSHVNINLELTDEWQTFCGISIPTCRGSDILKTPRAYI